MRSLGERISEHKRKIKPNISKAIKKYGIDNFGVNVIDIALDIDELNEKEIYWIKYYNCIAPNGYNQCEGGGNTKGYHHTSKTKKIQSELKKDMYYGDNNPFYGKNHSKEQKEKWSKARKGRKLSNEWKEKLSKSHWKKVINLNTGQIFDSIKTAGEFYNIESTHITRVCKGGRKSAGGYRWAYYNDNYMSTPIEDLNSNV